MVTRRLVLCLGFSQLVCWGISFYLIAVFGDAIAADLHWSRAEVYGGFSASLLVMGLVSPTVGRAVDVHGGRPIMIAGSFLLALGCAALATAHGLFIYYAAWTILGVAMRMTLYDAAFAALARVAGPFARLPISQITLLGGLAATTFWPIGHFIAAAAGWRVACLAYAGFALLTVPLHMAIPSQRYTRAADAVFVPARPLAATRPERILAAVLYALVVTFTTFLNSGLSAHMIGIMTGLGVGATLSIWVATLRGIGQSLARLCEILSGSRLNPLALGVLATSLLPICFIAGVYSGVSLVAAVAFAFLYGAGNGLVTIVRGTQPLVLFDHAVYGSLVGRLIMPGFFLSALAPVAYAFVIDRMGDAAALVMSAVIGLLVFAAAFALHNPVRANVSHGRIGRQRSDDIAEEYSIGQREMPAR